jgi:hypothetical protein
MEFSGTYSADFSGILHTESVKLRKKKKLILKKIPTSAVLQKSSFVDIPNYIFYLRLTRYIVPYKGMKCLIGF